MPTKMNLNTLSPGLTQEALDRMAEKLCQLRDGEVNETAMNAARSEVVSYLQVRQVVFQWENESSI